MNPLFSIIIPVYKVEAYLRKCLDSVLSQTCVDWECICVDDGSTDGSPAILDGYAQRDQRIKVIHQPNGGVSMARNVALEIAHGEWVQFLDADDSLENDFLEKIKMAIVKHPAVDAIEHTAIYCYDGGTRVYGDEGRLPPAGEVSAQQILSDPWGVKYTALGRCACYKIFRRSVLECNHLRFAPGVPIGEDSLFANRFYAYAGRVAICPDVAGYLRIFRDGSALKTITAEKLIPYLRADEVLYETWKERPTKGLAIALVGQFVMHISLGKPFGADIRSGCINALVGSRFFVHVAMPFVIKHGKLKFKLFAVLFLLAPTFLRKEILRRI